MTGREAYVQRHFGKRNAHTHRLNTQKIQLNKGEARTVSSMRDV